MVKSTVIIIPVLTLLLVLISPSIAQLELPVPPTQDTVFGQVAGDGDGTSILDQVQGEIPQELDVSVIKPAVPEEPPEEPLADTDGDGIPDLTDNCPDIQNLDQDDTDGDKIGDLCDDDTDGDAISNQQEIAQGTDPNNADTDGDSIQDGSDQAPTDKDTTSNGVLTILAADETNEEQGRTGTASSISEEMFTGSDSDDAQDVGIFGAEDPSSDEGPTIIGSALSGDVEEVALEDLVIEPEITINPVSGRREVNAELVLLGDRDACKRASKPDSCFNRRATLDLGGVTEESIELWETDLTAEECLDSRPYQDGKCYFYGKFNGQQLRVPSFEPIVFYDTNQDGLIDIAEFTLPEIK